MNLYILIAILAILVTVLSGALIWVQKPETVSCKNGVICKKNIGKKESIPFVELSEIKFSYHAVVGFIGIWEFISRGGHTVYVSFEAKGIDQMLRQLETELPGFSRQEFDTKFQAGDVEDALDVWKRA